MSILSQFAALSIDFTPPPPPKILHTYKRINSILIEIPFDINSQIDPNLFSHMLW